MQRAECTEQVAGIGILNVTSPETLYTDAEDNCGTSSVWGLIPVLCMPPYLIMCAMML